MSYMKRLILLVFVVLACVGCDQTTKGYAERYLPASQSVQFLGNTVRLQVAHTMAPFLASVRMLRRAGAIRSCAWELPCC